MKQSRRLEQLDSMITAKYEHIWDCCCDHGFLGMRLLDRQAASQVLHFVDVVPQLIDALKAQLLQNYGVNTEEEPHWQTHCADTAQLSLEQYAGRQLVIIAGVGGDQTRDFVQSIVNNNPTAEIDFLLCPVYHQYKLRELLIELDFRLLSECLLEENKRYYEILLIRSSASVEQNLPKISNVGSDIWMCTNQQQSHIAKSYLNKTLSHYQRKYNTEIDDTASTIKAYSRVCITSNS